MSDSTYQRWVNHCGADRLPTADDSRTHQLAMFLFAELDALRAQVEALESEMRIVRGMNRVPAKA